jgi:FKBP-type peptidyl-prolyl cis-trans isomerase SlyD
MSASRRGPASDEFQVGPGMRVKIRYRVFDEDGEPAEETPSELEYVHGMGTLLPALEAGLDGARAGTERSVTLGANQAFGPRKKTAIVEFSPEDFPPDVAAGDRFDADTEDGGVLLLRILEVRPDAVVVDMNHPLAGQRVRFDLTVLEVRPASDDEIARAERQSVAMSASGPVIPVERLLRGPSKRYEIDPLAPADGADDEPMEN